MLTLGKSGTAALLITLTIMLGPRNAAHAEPSVVCTNPAVPSTCTLIADLPGKSPPKGGDGTGGGYEFNDGSGSVAEDRAAEQRLVDTSDLVEAPTPVAINSLICSWFVSDPQPAPDDAVWAGADPVANSVIYNNCDGRVTYAVTPNANAGGVAPMPPPDPEVLAQQAIGQLRVPMPSVGVGPDRAKLAVNVWTWLWVDEAPPVSVTVAAGGVSVTATATLTSTTWSLGEPVDSGGGYQPGPPVTLTCAGAGVPPPAGYDWKAEPPCGHMFRWRSLGERTGGSGMWPVTATTNWAVVWESNTGVAGTDSLTATAADQFDVSEYRIVLVGPGG